MSTVAVWILLVAMPGYRESSITIIDNIATQQECMRVQATIGTFGGRRLTTRCVEVIKAK